ncbi:hypothetical protein ACFQE1_04390 [Halobium palmae]|uniref:Uncharacterized protein n=1 Tax=Halobium palmae TaxID=1776492 RepID=A0ABD5RW81_9EURY
MNHRTVDRSRRRADQPTEHLQELAHVERLLRADTRATDPTVAVGPSAARISFESARHNAHARGSLTASVVNEIAHSEAWGVATVHDPHPDETGVESMLTVVYAPEKQGGER